MRLLEVQNRIRELMGLFVNQVELAKDRTDINIVSETVLLPLFSEVYGYDSLENLNYTQGENYPGIDLGDKTARVAFQVTATANSEKVKRTLRKFVEYRLYEQYDRLIIYILTRKQESYSGKGYQDIIQDRFNFDKGSDILDARDILRHVNNFQIDRALRVKQFLEANFGDGIIPWYSDSEEIGSETLYLNLLEFFLPEDIYVADIDINKEQVIRNSKHHGIRVGRRSSDRNVIRAAIEQRGSGFGVDWVCHEGKIITFHNLTDFDLPLSGVVDKGTITSLGSNEFYRIDENHARVFKHLIRRCFQQKLYHQGVSWQYQEKFYIFKCRADMQKRTEEWYSKKKNSRTVCECKMKSDQPDEIWYCKHLAFQTGFKFFGTQWYVLIKPEWFFSYNGYKKSYYSSEKVEWLKRKEANMHIFNHIRFISYFLKHGSPSTLFDRQPLYPFLRFGELISFDSAPSLDDDNWRPQDSKQKQENLLPLFEDL
jgi:hypothetical protein